MIVDVLKASKMIQKGDVVAIPTETVYGLAADAMNAEAVKKTFQLKKRPADNPLIVHISDLDQLDSIAKTVPPAARKLADAFWPGPITLVMAKDARVPDVVTGGLGTVAVRMPDHQMALHLIRLTGPLTAPSANRSGRPSPTRVSHITEDFGNQLAILDGGDCKIGLESTVLDITSKTPKILRPGAISKEMIEKILETNVQERVGEYEEKPSSPGVKYSHYKPKARVIWISTIPDSVNNSTYYLIHSDSKEFKQTNVIGYRGNFEKMARELYDQFRTADHLAYSFIAVESLPANKISPVLSALRDRINRAAG